MKVTRRQRQVLALLAEGMTYQEVADELGLSYWTVKRVLSEAYLRLGVQTGTPAGHAMTDAFRVLGWLRVPYRSPAAYR